MSFVPLLVLQLWVAHALVFFAHEYAHSFTAWAFGWKANPLALHYPLMSCRVLLLQLGINQNVDEAPIFASGHRVQAGWISAAGMLFGNAFITLPLGARGLHRARQRGSRAWVMFWFWVCLASVGNLIDYVPVRLWIDGTDSTQDMYAAERGFGLSPWILLGVLGPPILLVLLSFFKACPRILCWLAPLSRGQRVLLAILTCVALFTFYGAAGWSETGQVAHRQSVVSVFALTPLACAWLIRKVWSCAATQAAESI